MSINAGINDRTQPLPGYPFAPVGWQEADARRLAREQGIELGPDHREVLRALQEYFARHDKPDLNMRELHDALDECFHARGGMRYLYRLLPGGPVAQVCQCPPGRRTGPSAACSKAKQMPGARLATGR